MEIVARLDITGAKYSKILESVMNNTVADDIIILVNLANSLSSDDSSDITFERKVHNGKAYNIWSLNQIPKPRACMWCLEKFTTKPVGIPVDISYRTSKILTKSSSEIKGTLLSMHNHRTTDVRLCGIYCSYQCAAAGCKNHFNLLRSENKGRVSSSSVSMEILEKLYKVDYPNTKKELTPCPSPLIQKKYGGILTEEEYKRQRNKPPRFRVNDDFSVILTTKKWIES